jgi:Ca2+-binding EF-hand superfamily protein
MNRCDPAKKSDKLEVRLPHATKQAFLQRCRAEGRSASEAVRGFIDSYPARPLTQKELPMNLRPALAYAAATAALIIGVVTPTATSSRAAPDFKAIFNGIDSNHDGKVTKEEMTGKRTGGGVTGNPNGKRSGSVSLSPGFDDLDVNRDGAVVFAEFEAFSRAAMKQAFLQMDANSDGKITLAEMHPARADAKSNGMKVSGDAEAFFMRFDKNKGGALTEAAFSDLPS